jgi:hypothetical protein
MPILVYNLDLDLWECLPIAVSSAVETLGLCFVNCMPPLDLEDPKHLLGEGSLWVTFFIDFVPQPYNFRGNKVE